MTCEHTRERLTAYLDGDLDADRGTVIRGHLRGCEACRRVAADEAALRDGLRQLPTLDPPSSLWSGVQARLAAVEVAEAKRPAWRRMVARWAPSMPRFAAGGLVAAAAVTIVWWRTDRTPVEVTVADKVGSAIAVPSPEIKPSSTEDVTVDLAGDAARRASSYATAAKDLLSLATEARKRWTDEQRTAFDAKLVELRETIASSPEGKARQRAWQSLVRYLQGAVVRDDVVAMGDVP